MRAPHGKGGKQAGKKRGRYQRRDRPDTRAAAVQAIAYVLLRKLDHARQPLRRVYTAPAPQAKKPRARGRRS